MASEMIRITLLLQLFPLLDRWAIAAGFLFSAINLRLILWEYYYGWSNYNKYDPQTVVACVVEVMEKHYEIIRFCDNKAGSRSLGEKLATRFRSILGFSTRRPGSLISTRGYRYYVVFLTLLSLVPSGFGFALFAVALKENVSHTSTEYWFWVLSLCLFLLIHMWLAKLNGLKLKMVTLGMNLRQEADDWAQSTGKGPEERLEWYLEEIATAWDENCKEKKGLECV